MQILIKIIIFVLVLLCVPFAIFGVTVFIRFLLDKKKYKKIIDYRRKFSDSSLLRQIFVDLPKALVRDLLSKDPNAFPLYGLILVTGPQGCGKTMTLNYLIRKYNKIYPRLKIRTNFDCSITKLRIKSYEDLLTNANGIYGELDVIQELQTWADCSMSKNFPMSFLAMVTQQRHVHRCIIGDTQVFNRVAKQLRENTYQIIEPHTFFGCFTLCFRFDIGLDADANIVSKKLVEWFTFVHTDDLRNMYDSYSDITGLNL